MIKLEKNKLWYNKCKKIIPAACSTLAKSPSKLIYNFSPFCCQSAKDSHFIDIDGNEWLDCEMSMGTIIWGHNREFIKDAIFKQIEKGISYSIAGENELEYAELLLKKFPNYESIKFFKNGADSVMASIRASRYITGKTKVLSCEYHGWLDWSCFDYYQLSPMSLGIPESIANLHISCNPEKKSIVSKLDKEYLDIACIVLCPSSYSKEDLEEIVQYCHYRKILIIFDEVTSGVRFGYRGVSGAYNVFPDYLCISKGLTNGLPLAYCIANKEYLLVMEKLKISNAHSSENLSLAAAIACEVKMSNEFVWPTWSKEGTEIIESTNLLIQNLGVDNKLHIKGYPGNFHLYSSLNFYSDPFREFLIKEFSKEHIFTKGFILLSDAHTKAEILLVKQMLMDSIRKYATFI